MGTVQQCALWYGGSLRRGKQVMRCPVSCWSSQYVGRPTLCLENADCDGWVMSAVWRTVAFQNTSSAVSRLWGRRTTGRPHLRYKDVCVRDMKAVDIDTMSWEGLASDRTKWRSALKQHLKTEEHRLLAAAADKPARRKEGSSSIRPETTPV